MSKASPRGTGEIFCHLGPLSASGKNAQGRIVRVASMKMMPAGTVYWCREGDREWTPVPEEIAKVNAQRAAKDAERVQRLARRQHGRAVLALLAAEQGRNEADVEAECGQAEDLF